MSSPATAEVPAAIYARGSSVTRRLPIQGTKTATGKDWWDRTTVWGMLKNPAYTGFVAFGKTRIGPRRPQKKTQRGHSKTPRRTGSTYDTDSSEQPARK